MSGGEPMARELVTMGLLALLVLLTLAVASATTFHVVLGPPPGTRPVWRFWNNQTGHHFYTLDPREKANLEANYGHVMIFEGIRFYAWPDPNE